MYLYFFENENFASHAPRAPSAREVKFADFWGIELIKIYMIGSNMSTLAYSLTGQLHHPPFQPVGHWRPTDSGRAVTNFMLFMYSLFACFFCNFILKYALSEKEC